MHLISMDLRVEKGDVRAMILEYCTLCYIKYPTME